MESHKMTFCKCLVLLPGILIALYFQQLKLWKKCLLSRTLKSI